MTAVVVDASVAAKWFFPEAEADAAKRLLGAADPLIAPDLVIAELCNIAWRKLRVGDATQPLLTEVSSRAPEFFGALLPLPPLARRAAEIAVELDHPVYDCFYLALAEAWQTHVVTADRRFQSRVSGTPWDVRVRPLSQQLQ